MPTQKRLSFLHHSFATALRRGVLFAATAAFAFWLVVPRDARATIRNIGAMGCAVTNSTRSDNWIYRYMACSIPAGSDLSTDKLIDSYFDFWTYKSVDVSLYLSKRSYNGTLAQDYKTVTTPNYAHASDEEILPVNVKSNPSTWDYLEAYMNGANEVYGVIVTSSN